MLDLMTRVMNLSWCGVYVARLVATFLLLGVAIPGVISSVLPDWTIIVGFVAYTLAGWEATLWYTWGQWRVRHHRTAHDVMYQSMLPPGAARRLECLTLK